MKNSEIKALTTEELKDKIASAEKNLASLRFAHAVSSIENPMQIRDTKQLVARLKTELHARTLSGIAEKVASGELTNFNARAFLSANKFDTPIGLAKIKKEIAKYGK
jgi:large subunit ribosomal protein L29